MEKISSISEALIFLLRGIYDAEKKVRDILPLVVENATTPELISVLNKYRNAQQARVNKVEEIFDTLATCRTMRDNTVVDNFLRELATRLPLIDDQTIKEQTLVTTMMDIHETKAADCYTCLHFAQTLGNQSAEAKFRELLDDGYSVRQLFTQTREPLMSQL